MDETSDGAMKGNGVRGPQENWWWAYAQCLGEVPDPTGMLTARAHAWNDCTPQPAAAPPHRR